MRQATNIYYTKTLRPVADFRGEIAPLPHANVNLLCCSVDYHLPRRPDSTLPLSTMPVPTVAEPALDHQRRFEAAVDVIKKLPKNGMLPDLSIGTGFALHSNGLNST